MDFGTAKPTGSFEDRTGQTQSSLGKFVHDTLLSMGVMKYAIKGWDPAAHPVWHPSKPGDFPDSEELKAADQRKASAPKTHSVSQEIERQLNVQPREKK